jgi:enterochelin esterase-like enzyme
MDGSYVPSRANLIFDNLIADGKAKPMIVVMPSIFQQAALGSGAGSGPSAGTAPAAAGTQAGAARTASQDDSFTKELLGDIMPLIQKRYRVLTGPGLSENAECYPMPK